MYPPHPFLLRRDLEKFHVVCGDCAPSIALTSDKYLWWTQAGDAKNKIVRGIKSIGDSSSVQQPALDLHSSSLPWHTTDQLIADTNATIQPFDEPSHADDIAFLQYTSGSTGNPKGVMVTHANLHHNMELIRKHVQIDASSVNVSWLPQYHDMGLIGSHLSFLWAGASTMHMSPLSFLRRPARWIYAMSDHQGTHTQVIITVFLIHIIYA